MTALRPRLEHAQILTKTDMERVGKLGGEYSSILDESMEVELLLSSYCQHSTYTCVCEIVHPNVFANYMSYGRNSISDMWFAEDRLVSSLES